MKLNSSLVYLRCIFHDKPHYKNQVELTAYRISPRMSKFEESWKDGKKLTVADEDPKTRIEHCSKYRELFTKVIL